MTHSLSALNALKQSRIETSNQLSNSFAVDQVMDLFDKLRTPLLRYLLQFPLPLHDSEDVVQEVFLSLFQHLERGKTVENVRGWVFRAAHNLALKRRVRSRKDAENGGCFDTAEKCIVDPSLNPEDRLSFNRTQETVQAVIEALPEQHRCCLFLRAEGLRYRQIAEIMNISLGSVANALQRSLALIARATQR